MQISPSRHAVCHGLARVGKQTAKPLNGALHAPHHTLALLASTGAPLTDEDRWPWLHLIGDWISERVSRGESAVVACSALRRAYRDVLRRCSTPWAPWYVVPANSNLVRNYLVTRTINAALRRLHLRYPRVSPAVRRLASMLADA